MGEQCQWYIDCADVQKLSRSNKSTICNRCLRAGRTLEDVPASRSKPQKLKKRCRSCGKEFGDPSPSGEFVEVGSKVKILSGSVLLCKRCITGAQSRAGWGYSLHREDDSPLPLPEQEGFAELFKAAKVLLKKNAPERQVSPTLALAYLLCHDVERLVAQKKRLVGLWGDEQAWDEEVESFARRYSGLRPVEVAQEVLIFERRQVSIRIDYSDADGSPLAVEVSVHPHQTELAEPEEVASLYREKLSEARIPCDEKRTRGLTHFFLNDRLVLDITPGTAVEWAGEPRPGWRTDKASFPHPSRVQRDYADLCAEFSSDLKLRDSGGPAEAKNLVPACVAYCLREYGTPPRKKIERLLEEHGLWEPGEKPDSAKNQLWQNVKNERMVGHPLVDAARTLFFEGYE